MRLTASLIDPPTRAPYLTVVPAMVGGTDNNQLKASAEELVAVMAKARATERAMLTTTIGRQQRCIDNSNDDDATRKCLWQWLQQLWWQAAAVVVTEMAMVTVMAAVTPTEQGSAKVAKRKQATAKVKRRSSSA
jgi:hypothetical protein